MTEQLQPSETSPKAPEQPSKNIGCVKLFVSEVRSFLYLF